MSLNGSYIRMLRVALKVNWWNHISKAVSTETSPTFQANLPGGNSGLRVTVRHGELSAHHFILWVRLMIAVLNNVDSQTLKSTLGSLD